MNTTPPGRVVLSGDPVGGDTANPTIVNNVERLYRLPKIIDMRHGTVAYDARIALKQPDWTYVDVRRAG
ncbi:MAG: hypothetical protein ACRDZS_09000 [Acidimicrobiales bacterium]